MAKKIFTDESLIAFIEEIKALFTNAKSHSDTNLETSKIYTDEAVEQKTEVQIITWEADD